MSSHREIELTVAQSAFQDIVDAHKNCRCVPKKNLTEQITLIAEEIVKSKIRDKLLMASRTEQIAKKLAKIEIGNDTKKEKESDELLKLRRRVVQQSDSIKNQAACVVTCMEKSKNLNEEIDQLKKENLKLMDENSKLLARLDEMLK